MASPVDPRLLREVRAARRFAMLAGGLAAAAAALVIAQAFLVAGLVAQLVNTARGERPEWARGLVLIGALALLRAAVAACSDYAAAQAAATSIADLRERIARKVVALGPRWVAGRADTAALATQGLDALEPYLTKYLPALLTAALVVPAMLVAVGVLDWVAFLICMVTVPLIPIFMWLIGKMTAGISERRMELTQRLGAQVLDLLAGLPTLKAFGREHGPGKRVRTLGAAARDATMGALRVAFLSSMVLEFLATLAVAIVAVSVGLRLLDGGITLAAGLAVIMLAPEVFLPLRQVGAQFHASTDGLAAIGAAFAILALPDAVPNGSRDAGFPTAIRFDDVSLRGGDRGILAPYGLSATIPLRPNGSGHGRVIALAGPTGAGKSSAIEMLLGLVSPTSGRVILDYDDGASAPLADVDLPSWWAQVCWVPQRPTIAPGTIWEAMWAAAGLPEPPNQTASEAQAAFEAAAALAGFDSVVARLPQGVETRVGLGGVGLSVGERQRLALTGALLAGGIRRLVILDEPTAHLDSASEVIVLAAIQRMAAAGQTVLVAAHRKSVLEIADQVIDVRANFESGIHGSPNAARNRCIGDMYTNNFSDCRSDARNVIGA